MRVLIVGGGRFGAVFAEEFARYDLFKDVVVGTDQHSAGVSVQSVRRTADWNREEPDIVVLAASRVPAELRREMSRENEPIEEFWKIEEKYNTEVISECFEWLYHSKWKVLIVATNPSHHWANILRSRLPGRPIYGFGSAFDNARIKSNCCAMMPELRGMAQQEFRILGEHGAARNFYEAVVPSDVFETARWMSNAASVAFINAPLRTAETWWKRVGIQPLVHGLSGSATRTHVIAPVLVGEACASIGVDVTVQGLEIQADNVAKDRKLNSELLEGYLTHIKKESFRCANLLK